MEIDDDNESYQTHWPNYEGKARADGYVIWMVAHPGPTLMNKKGRVIPTRLVARYPYLRAKLARPSPFYNSTNAQRYSVIFFLAKRYFIKNRNSQLQVLSHEQDIHGFKTPKDRLSYNIYHDIIIKS